MRHVVYICGEADSGILGRTLCEELGYEFMNTNSDDRIPLDLFKAENIVISGPSMAEERGIPYITLVVCLKTDTDNTGAGSQEKRDLWKKVFRCPQILLDGAGDREENCRIVKRELELCDIVETIKEKIVQDADRWDAIGALGIARAFAFGGSRGRTMYEPEFMMGEGDMVPPGVPSTTIFHFYEKLFLLKDGMNTETARTIAVQRDTVMQAFLDEFFAEWNGKR